MKLLQDWKNIKNRIEGIKLQDSEAEISHKLYHYLILGEDHRFHSHFGCDPIALLRAIWQSTFRQRRQGGSTIAMQLVRTITGNYQITIKRKIAEIILAILVTKQYCKQDILSVYLEIAYLGWNMHGVKQACNRLNINIKNLSDAEAASIIARLKYPEPKTYDKRQALKIKHRTAHILTMQKMSIYKEQYGAI
jgi:penicillin-binding protein 1A